MTDAAGQGPGDAAPPPRAGRQEDPFEVNRRTRQRQVLLFAGVVAGILLLSYILSGTETLSPPARAPGAAELEVVDIITAGQAVEDADLWRGRAEAELVMLRQDNEALRDALDDLAASLERMALPEQRWSPPAEDGWEREPAPPAWEAVPDPYQPEPAAPVAIPAAAPAPPSRGIAVVTAPQDAPAAAPSGEEEGGEKEAKAPGRLPHHRARIPAGSFVKAVLLGSLDAPTGQSGPANPHPVLLRLEERAWLPNRRRRDIRECLVTAAGYGDLSSERAYIRTERLSCVTRGGLVVDIPVKGHVAGEDGKTGVRGNLVSRKGRLLARSLFAGVVSGIGGVLHDRDSEIRALGTAGGDTAAVRSYTRGREFRAGVADGLSGSLEKLSDYYLELADRMHPVIEVSAGRRVDIVFQEGVDLPGLDDVDAAAAPAGGQPSPMESRHGRHAGRRAAQ